MWPKRWGQRAKGCGQGNGCGLKDGGCKLRGCGLKIGIRELRGWGLEDGVRELKGRGQVHSLRLLVGWTRMVPKCFRGGVKHVAPESRIVIEKVGVAFVPILLLTIMLSLSQSVNRSKGGVAHVCESQL